MARHYASTRFPTSPAELAQALADKDRFAELFPDAGPQSWQAFAEAYAAASPYVKELEQLAAQQAMQALPAGLAPRVDLSATAAGRDRLRDRYKLFDKRAPGAPLDGVLPATEFPLSQIFSVVNRRNHMAEENRGLLQQAAERRRPRNALSERIPAEGGFLVPENLRSEILMTALEKAIIRPRCRIIPMDSLRVPIPNIDDTSHVSSVYGGVIGYWTEEGAAITPSAPSFGRSILEAQKLTCYTTIPNELIQDAGELLEMWLRTQLPDAIAFFEDIAFIGGATVGTGVGEPQGFLNSPGAVKYPAATAHTIVLADVIGAYCRMLPVALPGSVWLCSPDAKQQLLSMAFEVTISASTSAISPPAWLAGLNAIAAEPSTLFGLPLIVSEKMPSSTSGNTTTAGALSLCNFDWYLIGDRQSLQLAVSEEFLFSSDLVAYRLIERVAGRAWMQSPLTPANGSTNTLSPFVLVDTTT